MSWLECLILAVAPYQKLVQKPITTKSIEVEEEDEEDAPLPPPKPSMSLIKKDKKISAQSTHIKDLRLKLDQAVAENSQIRELLLPAMLTMAFSNALSATKTSFTSQSGNRGNQQFAPKPFLGKYHPSKLMQQERMVPLIPTKPAITARTQGTLLENCVWLEARNKFVAEREKKEKEGLN